LEEEKEKNMVRENEEFTRKENVGLIYSSFGYKGKIPNLSEELSKLMEQNKKLVDQLVENSKVGQNVAFVKENYELKIKNLKINFSKEFAKAMKENGLINDENANLKIKMNRLEIAYLGENNTLKLEVELLRLELSNANKRNEELNKALLVMEEQISELFMQIKMSREEIKILSNGRRNLIACIIKNENELQIKIFNAYKERNDKVLKEDKEIINCLLNGLALARKEIFTLNQIESIAKVNIKILKIQFKDYDLQQIKWKLFIILYIHFLSKFLLH